MHSCLEEGIRIDQRGDWVEVGSWECRCPMCCRCLWKLISELGPALGEEVLGVFVESP